MKEKKVCILDYGCGNVRSVYNMFATITDSVAISNNPEVIESATHLVLPGVGAFGASMERIKNKIPLDIVEKEVLDNKKPFLGICVGLQVLAEKGHEFGEYEGVGWIPGEVVKLKTDELPLPHVGWNSINITRPSQLLKQFRDEQDFYFVHSYMFKVRDDENIVARTSYGEEFPSIVARDNIFGVQFHPEKSQKAGKILLENFLGIE